MHCITESNMLSVKKTSPNKRYRYIPLTNKNVNIFNAYKDNRYKKTAVTLSYRYMSKQSNVHILDESIFFLSWYIFWIKMLKFVLSPAPA